MKKLLTVLVFLAFVSCGKIPKCWNCTMTTTSKGFVYVTSPEIKTEQCKKTKKEIEDYEKTNTYENSNVYVVTECN